MCDSGMIISRGDLLRLLGHTVRVSVWLCGLPFWLRRHTLPGLLARLTPAGGAQPPSSRAPDMHRLVQHIVWLCRLPLFRAPLFPRACLRQSLALYYALSRRGYAVTIHFGVRKDEDVLQGHSWVTVQGIPVAEHTPVEAFHVVYAYPPVTTCSAHHVTAGDGEDEVSNTGGAYG
jgi:Transglutaminase-like superfamily